jgi:hypothetical protein
MTASSAHVPSLHAALANHDFEIAAFDAIAAAHNGRFRLAMYF